MSSPNAAGNALVDSAETQASEAGAEPQACSVGAGAVSHEGDEDVAGQSEDAGGGADSQAGAAEWGAAEAVSHPGAADCVGA